MKRHALVLFAILALAGTLRVAVAASQSPREDPPDPRVQRVIEILRGDDPDKALKVFFEEEGLDAVLPAVDAAKKVGGEDAGVLGFALYDFGSSDCDIRNGLRSLLPRLMRRMEEGGPGARRVRAALFEGM